MRPTFPQYNLGEVIEGLLLLENPEVTIAQLMKNSGPDFTAGFIYGNVRHQGCL